MSDLPFVDAHEAIVRAGPEAVWDAAADVVARFGSPMARARLLTDRARLPFRTATSIFTATSLALIRAATGTLPFLGQTRDR
jgi:hypothetical protein